jgi:hypothetical protein
MVDSMQKLINGRILCAKNVAIMLCAYFFRPFKVGMMVRKLARRIAGHKKF